MDESLDDSRTPGRLEPEVLVGVVDTALAAEAGRWEIVAKLAEVLAMRRRERGEPASAEQSAGRLAAPGRAR